MTPWKALGAEHPLEAHVPGTVITHPRTEDQLRRFSSLRYVPVLLKDVGKGESGSNGFSYGTVIQSSILLLSRAITTGE